MSKRPNPYTISFSQQEREKFEKLATNHGFKTLSSLIRRALAVVEANPMLLSEFSDIESDFQQAYSVLADIQKQTDTQLQDQALLEAWKMTVDKKLDWILEKLATSKQDKQEVKKLHNSTGAMEAIFDE